MSDVEKKISILFDDEGSITKITARMRTFENTTRQSTGSLSGLHKVGGQLLTRFFGITAAISMGIKAFHTLQEWVGTGIKQFRAFEIRIAEISSIMTEQNRVVIPSLEAGIVNLSTTYGQSVEDLSKGYYEIISAAFKTTDAMKLLNVVTKASIAGLTTVTGAVKTFTGVLNAYGMSAAHAQKLSDQLFTAVVRGNFVFSDLEASLGYVTPIASEAGVSIEEVLSAMTSATRQGQHLDSVTRGLGLLIQNIINPTNEAAEAAKKYGIEMDATSLRVNGLLGFLKQVSDATQKYGTQILPELIGNMRSLRVVMALASEAGIKGFTDDMELMRTATGRTEDALNQIMATQQKLADVIEQTMEKVNRSVGEAWTGFDIWWKKTQVWWGTLFSGGNASKAVSDIDKRFKEIYLAAYTGITSVTSITKDKKKTSLYDMLFGPNAKEDMKSILNDTSRLSDIKKYLDLTKEIENVSETSTVLGDFKTGLNAVASAIDSVGEVGKHVVFTKEILEKLGIDIIPKLSEQAKKLGYTFDENKITYDELKNIISQVNTQYDVSITKITSLQNQQNLLQGNIDDIVSAFEDASAQIDDYKLTIVSLEAEIKKLEKTIPEHEFQLKIAETELPIEKFQHYSSLATKYGGEFLNEWTNVFDEYGNSMEKVIKTIYDYNDALEEQKKADKEAEEANNTLAIAMQRNNLEILKIQLAGMTRRRGNTRAEQRQLKNLEIENTKIRIQQMEEELKKKEATLKAGTTITESAYDEAQFILQRYIDFQNNKVYELENSRQREIDNLRETINYEKEELERKKTNLTDTYTALNTTQQKYLDALKILAEDPSLKDAYEKILGLNIIQTAFKSYSDYYDFVQKNPIPAEVTTPEATLIKGKTLKEKFEPLKLAMEESTVGKKMINIMKIRGIGKGIFYQRGTYAIPSTGLYLLHKYEQVLPAGKELSNIASNVVININNPVVKSEDDIIKLAKMLRNYIRADLKNKKTGESKFKMM